MRVGSIRTPYRISSIWGYFAFSPGIISELFVDKLQLTGYTVVDIFKHQFVFWENSMGLKGRFLLLAFVMSVLVSGCYNKPVRHLASDVSLLKIGQSTQEDVLVYLGDPDDIEDLDNGEQKWIYRDEKADFFEKTPFVGEYIGTPEERRVEITLKNGVVSNRVFTAFDEDDLEWSEDFSWQETE